MARSKVGVKAASTSACTAPSPSLSMAVWETWPTSAPEPRDQVDDGGPRGPHRRSQRVCLSFLNKIENEHSLGNVGGVDEVAVVDNSPDDWEAD